MPHASRLARALVAVTPRLRQAACAATLATACLLCCPGAMAFGTTPHKSSAHPAPTHPAHTRRACRHHAHRRCAAEERHKHKSSTRVHSSASDGTTNASNQLTTGNHAAQAAPFSPTLEAIQPTPPPPAPSTPAETASPPEQQSPSQGPARLQVSAKEFSFTLSRASAPAGKLVLELVNAGQDEHNLHIRPAAGGPDVGAMPTLLAGHHEDVEFNLPAGTYTFYCGMPGHEALGMKATFTVQ
jgi:plastocyanin